MDMHSGSHQKLPFSTGVVSRWEESLQTPPLVITTVFPSQERKKKEIKCPIFNTMHAARGYNLL